MTLGARTLRKMTLSHLHSKKQFVFRTIPQAAGGICGGGTVTEDRVNAEDLTREVVTKRCVRWHVLEKNQTTSTRSSRHAAWAQVQPKGKKQTPGHRRRFREN